MDYKIPQYILDATDCSKKLTCITDVYCKGHVMCEVHHIAEKYVTFLNPGAAQEVLDECPYADDSCDMVVCKCPTRYFLHKEYGI